MFIRGWRHCTSSPNVSHCLATPTPFTGKASIRFHPSRVFKAVFYNGIWTASVLISLTRVWTGFIYFLYVQSCESLPQTVLIINVPHQRARLHSSWFSSFQPSMAKKPLLWTLHYPYVAYSWACCFCVFAVVMTDGLISSFTRTLLSIITSRVVLDIKAAMIDSELHPSLPVLD
jgi:hypothetical protein